MKTLRKTDLKIDGCWICTEKYDDYDNVIWLCSTCEFALTLNHGEPTDNNYYYCPQCGSQLLQKKPPQ